MCIPAVLAVAWVLAVGAGMGILLRYESRPGAPASPRSERWPEQSALRRAPGRATLVMVAHPRCPCTRASLAELARLMIRCGDRVSAHVLFVLPPGKGAAWGRTDLWRSARAIPGVDARLDPGGIEARRCFGAATSGQTFLYHENGRLLFRGGITAARGHEGDNAGSDAVAALVRDAGAHRATGAAPASTPVFGCALFDRVVQAGEVSQ